MKTENLKTLYGINIIMDTKTPTFWWLKNKQLLGENKATDSEKELDVSTHPLVDLFEKEQQALNIYHNGNPDVDVGVIIDEINRVAAQSPLGPYESHMEERSVVELMKEAEKIYMESSKSFEQLSQRSKTSQNISNLSSSSKDSTSSPKSISPLPFDSKTYENDSDNDTYSDDFSEECKVESSPLPFQVDHGNVSGDMSNNKPQKKILDDRTESVKNVTNYIPRYSTGALEQFNGADSGNVHSSAHLATNETLLDHNSSNYLKHISNSQNQYTSNHKEELLETNTLLKIKSLEDDNQQLKFNIEQMKDELQQRTVLLQESNMSSHIKTEAELQKVLIELKDSKTVNTALQFQLNTLSQTHLLLKTSYDEMVNSNRKSETRVGELENSLAKYSNEIINIQRHRDKLLETESSLNKLLDIEKIQTKCLKQQNETDGKCIQDLNRQIKEMERIVSRKHPDSVSALIVAAKNDATESNTTARRILEDRIKSLEQEALSRDQQSSKVFVDIQDKFNEMKLKYESHIEDLELHVNDLKSQLKRQTDTFDIYTQTTSNDDQEIPEKETTSTYSQTDHIPAKPTKVISVKKNGKSNEFKTETHLIATIRGLQSDLSDKEKVNQKLHKELDELRKTNRRLQKEREGSLKTISDKREFRSYPEKLAMRARSPSSTIPEETQKSETQTDKTDFDKIKEQLQRIEHDYQNLKKKRLHDLNVLQEAHEREIAQYVCNVTPLREQLELQQMSLSTLQSQLSSAREELAIVTVERDHLNQQLVNADSLSVCNKNISSDSSMESLQRKVVFLEKRYEEREYRLRAIVNGLAKKNVTNRNCDQCANRQHQLIGYKMELDQLLATLRALQ